MKRILLSLATTVLGASLAFAQAGVTKEKVEGITNLSRVGTTVACAGAVTPAAIAGIKKMGFASVINLRLPDEPGNDIAAEEAAAESPAAEAVEEPAAEEAEAAAEAEEPAGQEAVAAGRSSGEAR